MSNSTVVDINFDDEQFDDPVNLERGTECEVELSSGVVYSGTKGPFIKLFGRPKGHGAARAVQITLNPVLEDQDEDTVRMNGRGLKRFGQGFGVPAKTLNSILAEVVEAHEQGSDVNAALEPLIGLTTEILTGIKVSKNPDFDDTSTVAQYLNNKLAKKKAA